MVPRGAHVSRSTEPATARSSPRPIPPRPGAARSKLETRGTVPPNLLRRIWRILVVLAAFLPPTDAVAQTTPTEDGGPEPSAIRVRVGPLAMTPRVELTNLGVDTNVFNEPNDANPK